MNSHTPTRRKLRLMVPRNPLPRFSDYIEPDAERLIARSLGKTPDGRAKSRSGMETAVEVHA
ncbi:MAG: hypothetical protein ACLFVW_02700 [Phycisphaerae bacterium]